jgi:hypothetical protein
LVVPAADGSGSIPVTVVYEAATLLRSTVPLTVTNGAAVIPPDGTLSGLYARTAFDFAASPLSAQRSLNYVTANVNSAPHVIANVLFGEGSEVVAVVRAANGVDWAIDGLRVHNDRIVVPFGPRLQSVVGVFDSTDPQRATNLLQAPVQYDAQTRIISNLSLADGATVVLDVVVNDYESLSEITFASSRVPLLHQGESIVGIFKASEIAGATLPITLTISSNLVNRGVLRESNALAFAVPPDSLDIAFVAASATGQRMITRNTAEYAFDVGTASATAARYSVIAIRRVMANVGQTRPVRSRLAHCVL